MKKTGLIIILLAVSTSVWAGSPEKKGIETINRENAEAYIGFLASDALQGREAGTQWGKIAGEYIVSNLKTLGVKPLFDSYYQPFEAYSKERQKKGGFQVHPDSISVLRQDVHRKLSLNNILCRIDGKNPDEYVIVGAHYDHLGFDPMLDGDKIYNGADDNASGVSAVVQIARAFVASGQKPMRTVIIALWDGEEKGLLGSRYFTENCPFIEQIKGYLNFDMIGRNNKPEQPRHVVYFYTAANPAFGLWLKDDIGRYDLKLEPDYRAWDKPTGGSDNASFAVKGIPIIWYHTDGHPDYHQPTDHAGRLNWEKVVDITKASFLNAWNLANTDKY